MNPSPQPPERIAKYDIQCVLGRGAMGVVYKGYDSQIERPVAIKVLHPHLREGEHGKDLEIRFVQEARAAARCLHPNIVTIFDFGGGDPPYIVMEYVEGIPLNAHLKSDTTIALPSATDITIQVLNALGNAHGKGIVHRDIKPANIILLENGSIKVSDFGVARLDTSDLTGTGFVVGTPNYISPEGLLGQQVDARSDLYSVGVLFFELISGQRPSREKNLEQSLARYVGPMARLLVKKSCRSSNNTGELLANLTAHIPNADERSQFIKAVGISGRSAAEPLSSSQPGSSENSSPARSARQILSDSQQQALTKLLAYHIGPLAGRQVKAACSKHSQFADMLSALAASIPDEAERAQFLSRAGKV